MPAFLGGDPAGADAIYALLRFAHFAALMLLWGGSGFVVLFCRPPLAQVLQNGQRGVWRAAGGIALATACLAILVEAARLDGDWSGAVDPDVLSAMTGIHTGAMWLAQIVLGVILLPWLMRPGPQPTGLTGLLSGAQLAALALGGHAAQRSGWEGDAQRIVQAAHLLAAGAWVGWLVPFAVCLRRLHVDALRAAIVQTLRRFSLAGHAAVCVAVLTGALNTAFVLGCGLFGPASGYRTLLLAKMAIVFLMMWLAILNRYVFVPGMRGDHDGALRALRRGTVAEIALGAAALALVSVFASMDPG